MTTDERKPTTYADLRIGHECSVPPDQKSAAFSVMEDGKVVLLVGRQDPDNENVWQLFEHLTMTRKDFNQWLPAVRKWWDEEKAHPLVPGLGTS